MKRTLLSVIAASLLAAPPQAARADDAGTRVAVVAGPRGALAARLAAELQASGLAVRVDATVDASSDPTRPDEVVVIIPEGEAGAIEVWTNKRGARSLVARVAPEGAVDTRV